MIDPDTAIDVLWELGAWVRKGQQGNGGFAVAVV